jgi:asparagine synthase (glutamine-hydrolysing)
VSAFTSVPAIGTGDDGFPGSICDESAHARATAALYPNIEHVLIPTVSGSLMGTLDTMSSASECPQLNPGNSCWFHAICADAASRGLRIVLIGANGNYTISWDGRRALANLLADGRIPEFLRLSRKLRDGRKSWPAVIKAGVRPLLPRDFRRALKRIAGARGVRIEDATGLRPEFAAGFGLNPQEAMESAEIRDARMLRVWSIRRHDFGGHLSGLRRLTGVEQMDPTSDRRVMEFCLSVPEERYCADGRRRALIKDAMAGMVPPKVLEERRKGRQSGDLVFHLTREKEEIGAELQRLKKIDLAVRALNLPMMDALVQEWPSPPYGRQEHAIYGTRLMRAISMGRFIRRLEEGTLFKDQFAEGTRFALSTTSV